MKYLTYQSVAFLTCMLPQVCCLRPIAAQATPQQMKTEPSGSQVGFDWSKQLLTASPDECRIIAKAVAARHDGTVLTLEGIVKQTINDPSEQSASVASIQLLGRFHASNAVPLLVQYLAFSPDGTPDNIDPTRHYYPYVQALVRIGFSSLGPLVEYAGNYNKPVRR